MHSQLYCLVWPAVNLTVLGSQYTLYSHVHHSFGLNDAFDRSVALLLTTKQNASLNAITAEVLEDSVHNKPLDQRDTANQLESSEKTPQHLRRQLYNIPLRSHNTINQLESSEMTSRTARSKILQQSIVLEQHDTTNQLENPEMTPRTVRPRLLQQRGVLEQHDTSNQLENPEQTPRTLKPRVLQQSMVVEHPCLHEGYERGYTWVAHGAHVEELPEVQLVGRSVPVTLLVLLNTCKLQVHVTCLKPLRMQRH